MLEDPGLGILLTVQLAVSILAMIAWSAVVRKRSDAALKWAALATAAWFAFFATTIAYVFDVGWLP